MAAPRVRRATCLLVENCLAVVVEVARPAGPQPVRYVLDGPRVDDEDCDISVGALCVATLVRAPVETCDYTLRAVDASGRRSPPSAPFCIARVGVGVDVDID